MHSRRVFSVLLIMLVNSTSSAQTSDVRSYVQQLADAVSRDSLMSYIETLESFGTRYEYTPQRDSAASHIAREFTRWGLETESDPHVFGKQNISDIDLVGDSMVCLVGSGSMVVVSSDDGTTWRTCSLPSSTINIDGVDFVDEMNGWAVGGVKIFHTYNGGSSWVVQNVSLSFFPIAVSFADRFHGIAVGGGSVSFRTTDGGASWQAVPVPAIRLTDVDMIDSSYAWSVGTGGTILATSDGGETWKVQTSGITPLWNAIDMISRSHGWVVGGDSVILRTVDGGITWSKCPPPKGVWYLRSVSFVDSLHGWILDGRCAVGRTETGGATWQITDPISVYAPGRRIAARDTQHALIVGSNGLLLRTSDSGNTWATLTPHLPPEFIHESRNIVATIRGKLTPGQECVIVGHYDSDSSPDPFVSAPGANDNASGTSAVMEAARVCSRYEFANTVRFLAVSGEEQGSLGSQHYVQEAVRCARSIVGVVNGDMIGYPTTVDTTCLVVASYLVRIPLLDSALVYNQRYGIGLRLRDTTTYTTASDHGPFALAGYPTLIVSEATFEEIVWAGADPYLHTPSDTHDKLHPGLVRRGAQIMLATIAELARPLRMVTFVPAATEFPSAFELDQNYPNPFNPSTTIRYELPKSSIVRLSVWDILGREISVLVSERKDAGVYEVNYNASGLSSGAYVYRLLAGDLLQSRKLLILR